MLFDQNVIMRNVEQVCVFLKVNSGAWCVFCRVSVQKSKWDSSRSMRYNQDAQREEGKGGLYRK